MIAGGGVDHSAVTQQMTGEVRGKNIIEAKVRPEKAVVEYFTGEERKGWSEYEFLVDMFVRTLKSEGEVKPVDYIKWAEDVGRGESNVVNKVEVGFNAEADESEGVVSVTTDYPQTTVRTFPLVATRFALAKNDPDVGCVAVPKFNDGGEMVGADFLLLNESQQKKLSKACGIEDIKVGT